MQALNGHFKEPQSHSSSLLKLQRLNTTAMLSPRFLELRKIHISDSCKAFFRNSIQWLKPQERLGISHSSSLLKLQGLVPPKTTAVLWTVPLSPSLLELHMSDSCETVYFRTTSIEWLKGLAYFWKSWANDDTQHRLQLVRGNDYGFRLWKVATSGSQKEMHFGRKFWPRDHISVSF